MVLEILILWIAIYQIYRLFRATRGARIIIGLTVILVAITLISQLLDLAVLEWIITKAVIVLAFALLVIFQPELRSGLARLGSSKFGALFAIERSINLDEHLHTGVKIDSELSKELVLTIFHPKTALHDGGLIIRNERAAAAACIFPISQKELSDRSLGLRHRAGIGMAAESDAVAIIVSEETGNISLCIDDQLEHHLSDEALRERLNDIFLLNEKPTEKMAPEQLDGENDRADSSDRDLVSD
nr:cyclic di-AMP synthase CdaA-like [Nerophis lumbriciformis]